MVKIKYRKLSDSECWFDLHIAGQDYSIQFCFSEEVGLASDSGDAALAVGLLPAMLKKEPLELLNPVCPKLIKSIDVFQDIYSMWYEPYSKVEVQASARESGGLSEDRKVGVFFSGGVDACFSLLKHLDEIDTLVHIYAFDGDRKEETWEHRHRKLMNIAEEYGKQLLVVRWNLIDVTREIGTWPKHFATAQIAVAHALGSQYKKFIIPTGITYKYFLPWSSHPLLDPLWSSKDVEIEHSGAETTRTQKVARLSQHESLMENLHVCWHKADVNCGLCVKCIRTMTALRACGQWEKYQSLFETPLDLKKARFNRVEGGSNSYFAEILDHAQIHVPHDKELIRYLKNAYNEKYNKGFWRLLRLAKRKLRKIRTGSEDKSTSEMGLG